MLSIAQHALPLPFSLGVFRRFFYDLRREKDGVGHEGGEGGRADAEAVVAVGRPVLVGVVPIPDELAGLVHLVHPAEVCK